MRDKALVEITATLDSTNGGLFNFMNSVTKHHTPLKSGVITPPQGFMNEDTLLYVEFSIKQPHEGRDIGRKFL